MAPKKQVNPSLSPQALAQQQMGEVDGLREKVDDLHKVQEEMGEQMEAIMRRLALLEARGKGTVGGDAASASQSPSAGQLEANFQAIQDLRAIVDGLTADSGAAFDGFRRDLETVTARLDVTIRAMRNPPGPHAGGGMEFSRVKMSEPKYYFGERDAKLLENFLFDMEHYFLAVRAESEEIKVSMATMYLSGDAKLWWRTKYQEIQQGRCQVDSWEDLRRELKSQFFPKNASSIARDKILDLKHTGSVREYVKKFAGYMLDIQDMAESDKVHQFIRNLKPWAKTELNHLDSLDLVVAIIVAES